MAIGIGHMYPVTVRVLRRGAPRAAQPRLSFRARQRSRELTMLLALFLIDLAAGLYLFLPLVGRRNAGVKFYRLILHRQRRAARCARRSRIDGARARSGDRRRGGRRAHGVRLRRAALSEAAGLRAFPRCCSASAYSRRAGVARGAAATPASLRGASPARSHRSRSSAASIWRCSSATGTSSCAAWPSIR